MNADYLLAHYDQIADAPDSIARLRRFILDLAVRGKLVPQVASDESASALLKKIATEKARLANAGELRRPKPLPAVDQPPFDLPQDWRWTRIREIASDRGQEVPRATFTYIDVTSIDKEAGIVAEPKLLEAKDAPSRARKIARKGDVIFSCVRPYLLNVAVIETDFEPPPVASTAFAILNGHGLVLPRYIWIVLRSPFMVGCVETNQRGQAYPAINDADFAVLPFPLPPLAEQHRIVAKVDKLMGLCDRLEAARAAREAARDRLAAASLARLNTPETAAHRTAASASSPPPNALFRTAARAATDSPVSEQVGRGFADHARFVLDALPTLTARPDQIKALRQSILNLAVRGRLVPQDAKDEPAVDYLLSLSGITGKTCKLVKVLDPSHCGGGLPASWAWLALGGIISGMDAGWSPQCENHPRSTTEEWGVLKTTAVQALSFDLMQHKLLPAKMKPRPQYQAEIGDILVTRAGPKNRVGISCVINVPCPRLMISDKLIRFHALGELSARYIALTLNAGFTYDQIEAAKSGMAVMQMNISQEKLRAVPIPLPPLAEQYRIVAKVDALMAVCDRLEASLTATAATRRRLLDALLVEALEPDVSYPREVVGSIGTDLAAQSPVNYEERSAFVLAFAFDRHRSANRDRTFGHVKAQKILHLVEAETNFDLGRVPIKDAAGPNDFPHLLATGRWAQSNQYFMFEKIGNGYSFRPLAKFRDLKAKDLIDSYVRTRMAEVVDLFVPMDMRSSEVFVTVYAAWNNLLIEGRDVTDEDIVRAAREDWHLNKESIPRDLFFKALKQLKMTKFIPIGKGKIVGEAQPKSLFR